MPPSIARTSVTQPRLVTSAGSSRPMTSTAPSLKAPRIRSTVPYSRRRPWSMSRMRSQRVWASPMSCVLMTTAVPLSRCSRTTPLSMSALTGSRPWNGSSMMSRSGSLRMVAMSWAFWCMPRDSSPARLVAASPRPITSSSPCALRRASDSPSPRRDPKYVSVSMMRTSR